MTGPATADILSSEHADHARQAPGNASRRAWPTVPLSGRVLISVTAAPSGACPPGRGRYSNECAIRCCIVTPSLRFGPHPPDLPLADPSGREFRTGRTTEDFAIVRVRLGGRWVLGVLRGWRRAGASVIIRMEAPDPATGDVRALWYRFVPESIDPVVANEATGELRLVPPTLRGGPGPGPGPMTAPAPTTRTPTTAETAEKA